GIAIGSALACGIYATGGWFAARTGAVSDNVLHLTALGDWFASNAGNWTQLGEFLLRGIASQGAVLAIALALVLRGAFRPSPELGAVVVLVLAVAAASPPRPRCSRAIRGATSAAEWRGASSACASSARSITAGAGRAGG